MGTVLTGILGAGRSGGTGKWLAGLNASEPVSLTKPAVLAIGHGHHGHG